MTKHGWLGWGILGMTLGACGAAQAQLTPERAIAIRRIGELEPSPDRSNVAFVVTESPAAESVRHLYLFRQADQSVRQLTSSSKGEWQPAWSPDGAQLAFLSNRDSERTRIWILPMAGGEAMPLSVGKLSVQRMAWSPDGSQIAFLAATATPDSIDKRVADKDDARVVDRDEPTSLWVVDIKSAAVRQVTRAPWHVSEFRWVPTGDRLALVATDHPDTDRWTERLWTIGLRDSLPRLVAAPTGPVGSIGASRDGKWLAYVAARGDGPSPHDLFVVPVAGGTPPKNLTGTSLDRPIEEHQWISSDELAVEVADGFRTRHYRLDLNGRVTDTGSFGSAMATGLVELSNGASVFVGESSVRFPELWYAPAEGIAAPITRLNPSSDSLPLVPPTVVRYRSFDGMEIEGAVLSPGGTSGVRHPLVVMVHGGPTGNWSDRFESWGQLLAAKGFAVFYPNIRGSTGYGWKFLTSNRADWGGGDFKDVMAGVDYLIAQGIADSTRLGIGGWSYGGYLASWAITQTTRFKAAVTDAGMSDLATEYGTEAGPAYDEWFYGLPYEKPEGFRRSSPLTFITRAKTPTLILQGEADVTDPISQSQMLYRALKRYGATTELVLYPREGHGLREPKHLVDRLRRVVDWFSRWLGLER